VGANIFVVAFYAAWALLTLFWTGLFALPATPHYSAMFSWGSTFGSFALVLIYLLLAVGAIRGLRDHPRRWMVLTAVIVSLLVTGGAIFGSIYKVGHPTVLAPYAAIGWFIVGLVVAMLVRGVRTACKLLTCRRRSSVIVTAETALSPGRDHAMFRKIVWATDGSAGADHALGYARDLARADGADLVVVHGEQLSAARSSIGYTRRVDEKDLEAKIKRQVAEMAESGIAVSVQVIGGHAPAATLIAEVAEEIGADLVVVGTRGHTPLAGLLLGSVTDRLLHTLRCPVLAVPLAAESGRAG
jgi:nucleotide-binding universal stress UspA family protein